LKQSRVRGKRRRNRSRAGGVIVRSLAFLMLVAACVAGVRWLDGPRLHVSNSSGNHPASVAATIPSFFQSPQVQSRNRRVVYPYSVVPGGVISPAELREAAEHDATVSEHYTGFNYKQARVITVDQPRLVYLSYRKGDHVYWSRKQASLHKGETLLTDGHITARTRCGNQVSVLPQSNTSPDEPTMAELDRPDALASGMDRGIPAEFDSKLLDLDPGLPLAPGGLSRVNNFAGGPPPGGFIPMPIGGGINGSSSSKPPEGGGCPPNGTDTTNCPPPPPPPPPPAPVPEPGTVVLMISGAAAVWARVRYKKA
jgi:hypothetical protein